MNEPMADAVEAPLRPRPVRPRRVAATATDSEQTRAAELLGVSERVLRYKLRKYGLAGAEIE